MKKTLTMVLAFALIFALGIGATLAWLTATSGEVKNTFTTSDINITLTETTGGEKKEFKMVPGHTIAKDPTVTVAANSEDCYLFVKVEKSTNFNDFMTYTMAAGWTQLTDDKGQDVDGVFYREVKASTVDQEFGVLKDDKVTVRGTVTKDMMNAIDEGTADAPTLTFTAYASQLYKSNGTEFTPAEAWAVLNP